MISIVKTNKTRVKMSIQTTAWIDSSTATAACPSLEKKGYFGKPLG